MIYTIVLTEQEETELRIMYGKGYDCGLWPVLYVMNVNHDGSAATYRIAESDMWSVYDEYNKALEFGNDPWGPFVAETLRPKLNALMNEVV